MGREVGDQSREIGWLVHAGGVVGGGASCWWCLVVVVVG